MSDPLKPSPALLCALGSIIVHAQEMNSADGHDFDRTAFSTLLANDDVRDWLRAMDNMAMLPKMRKS